jgi:hypothetical protein
MKTTRNGVDFLLFLVLVGVAAWAIPGAGHLLIRERKRAVIICATVLGLFATGLYIGSLGVLEPIQTAWYIFVGQLLTTPAVGVLTDLAQKGDYFVAGRPADIGLIYTIIAGLLNLLCISNAVYMAYCGRGQLIGEDENA